MHASVHSMATCPSIGLHPTRATEWAQSRPWNSHQAPFLAVVCNAEASNLAAAKTHRELFSEFYQDLTKEPLEAVLAANPRPQLSVTLFSQMMRDLQDCGGCTDPLEQVLLGEKCLKAAGAIVFSQSVLLVTMLPRLQASYAMGYNLAIEYLADYEKTWMLDSFRHLDKTILAPLGRPLSQWTFLEVRISQAIKLLRDPCE